MKRKSLVITAFLIHTLFVGFVSGLFTLATFKKAMYDPRTKFPEPLVYLYAFIEGEDNFFKWSLVQIWDNQLQGIRVEVVARVFQNQKSPDTDTHVVLQQGKHYVVGETVAGDCRPPDPPEGAIIVVRGFTRWDSSHFWWEIHPIISWRYATQEEISLFLKSEAETRSP